MYITSPTQIKPASLQFWLDAADTTTVYKLSSLVDPANSASLNGDPVGYWGDKSGKGNHFTYVRASTAWRPQYLTNEYNGLPVLRFINTRGLGSLASINVNNHTVFMVVKIPNFVNGGRLYAYTTADNQLDYQSAAGGAGFTLWQRAFVSPNRVEISSYYNGGDRVLVNTRGSNVFDVITYEKNTTYALNSVRIRNFLNGRFNQEYTQTTPVSTTTFFTRIGSGIAANLTSGYNGCNVDIAEVIVYNSILENWERESIEYYLAQKWNLPRNVYAINHGWWTDTNNWSVSGYTGNYGLPKEQDFVYTNTCRMSANISNFPFFPSIANVAYTPSIKAGGSIQMFSNTTSLSVHSIDGSGSTNSFIFVTSGFLGLTGNKAGNIAYSQTYLNNCGCIAGLSGTMVYLSGYRITHSAGATFRTAILALSSNLTLDEFYLNKGGSYASYRVVYTGGPRNKLIVRNSQISDDDINYDRGPNFLLSGWNSEVYFENCKIFAGAGGGGATGEGIWSFLETSKLYFNNCFIKTPLVYSNLGGMQYMCINLHRNSTSYFNNCNLFNDYSQNSFFAPARNCVVLKDSSRAEFNDCNFNSAGFEYCIKALGSTTCVISSKNMSALTPFVYMGYESASVSAVNYNLLSNGLGQQPIRAPRFALINGSNNSYIQQYIDSKNSTYYWTSGTTFSYPATSDVRSGTVYKNNSLTGIMTIPPASSVVFSTPVDNVVGTALLTFDNLTEYSIKDIPNDNSIGAKLKNITTSSAFSSVVLNSFNFSNYRI
jgi:hypothetical protein